MIFFPLNFNFDKAKSLPTAVTRSGIPVRILSCDRYDSLYKNFKKDVSAIGMGFYLNNKSDIIPILICLVYFFFKKWSRCLYSNIFIKLFCN